MVLITALFDFIGSPSQFQKHAKNFSSQDLRACRDSAGNSFLHRAVRYHNRELLEFLLFSARCDINAKNSIGLVPLSVALQSNLLENVLLLLQCPTIDCSLVQDGQQNTLLHHLAKKDAKKQGNRTQLTSFSHG
mmetsp:Transcript_15046/g.21083  ORF Transcript_15046/g.21083 Transcript_15046/m.21083 type:complete len:134 (+) Transcript_15046:51-452(+)